MTYRLPSPSGLSFGDKAPGFDRPAQLPRDEAERRRWQAANKAWWEAAPMRYDWRESLGENPGSIAYFEEIEPLLYRFPAIDPPAFRARVERTLSLQRERSRGIDRGRELDR